MIKLKFNPYHPTSSRLRRVKVVSPAFTIVELLVVIVVIGILAAISLVAYTGITSRAAIASLESDLKNASTQLEIDKTIDNSGNYPATKEAANNGAGLKSSPGTTFAYTYSSGSNAYCLLATNSNDTSYYINSATKIPTAGTCTILPTGFAMAWGGTSSDYGLSLVQTSDGGYAVTGYTRSYGAGASDMFLAKYTSDGTLSWSRTWGGTSDDNGNSLVQTSDGGYAVTGYTQSYGAGTDMFLAKYTSDGTLSWSKTWGSTFSVFSDSGSSLVQTSDGGYAVTGYTGSYGCVYNGMFLAKYDSAGTLSWNKIWCGTGNDTGNSLVQTSDGGYAVMGSTGSYGAGAQDMFLAKYTSDGTLSWSRTWGGAGGELGNSLVQTGDGGYAVTGLTLSYGAGNYDMFLAKYTSDGTLSWSKTWGGASNDYGMSLVQTSDGGYAVTGDTNSYGAGNSDVFLAKYDSSGTLSWNKTWGGTSSELGNSLVQTSDGGYAITGNTSSYGAGSADMFLAKYTSDGLIANCSAPMCQSPTADVSSPTAAVSSPTAGVSSPEASVSSPTADVSSPDAETTRILPITPVPTMTTTFSSQELYIAWPGDNQTVCKEWTVPGGNTIKGLLVSHETESGYDYFTVSSDDVEIYNRSGARTNIYVDLTSSPGTTLSACLSTDESTQEGYGGEVTGVLYN